MNISDPLEQKVAAALTAAHIEFKHESSNNGSRLDFYLPETDVYIEVKKYHSARSNEQLRTQENVILLQGKEAVELFCQMLSDLR